MQSNIDIKISAKMIANLNIEISLLKKSVITIWYEKSNYDILIPNIIESIKFIIAIVISV